MSKRERARMVVDGLIAIGLLGVVWLLSEGIRAQWGLH